METPTSATVAQFLEQTVEPRFDSTIPATPLYNVFRLWCETRGIWLRKQQWFGRQMTKLGMIRYRQDPGRFVYAGVKFKDVAKWD